MIQIGTSLWEDKTLEDGRVIPASYVRAEAYRNFFSGPTGELILEDLKRTLNYYRTTFDPNPSIAAFNEGQRAVIVAITNQMARAELPPPAAAQETDETYE